MRDAAKHPQCTGQPSQQRTIQSKESGVPRLRNPALQRFCSLRNKVTSSYDTNICIKLCSEKFLNWFAAQKNCWNSGPSYLFLQTPHKWPSVISLLCLHLTACCSRNAMHLCVPRWPVRPGSRDVLHPWLQVLLGGTGFGLRGHAPVSLADCPQSTGINEGGGGPRLALCFPGLSENSVTGTWVAVNRMWNPMDGGGPGMSVLPQPFT